MTAVTVANHTENYHGPCPTNEMFVRWEVSANGSGVAVVRFMQESRPIREETVAFSGPVSKVVTYRATRTGQAGGHYQGWIGSPVAQSDESRA